MIPPRTAAQFAAAKAARAEHPSDITNNRVSGAAALVFDALRSESHERRSEILELLGARWKDLPGLTETIAEIALDLDRADRAEAMGWSEDDLEKSAELRAELERNAAE